MDNNKRIFVDIRKPIRKNEAPPAPLPPEPKPSPLPPEPPREYPFFVTEAAVRLVLEPAPGQKKRQSKSSPIRKVGFAAIAALVIITAFSAIGFADLKGAVSESTPKLFTEFKEAGVALSNLETAKAKDSFENIGSSVASLKEKADRYGLVTIAELWGAAIPKLKAVPETFKNLALLSEAGFNFAVTLEDLKKNGFGWFTGKNGTTLIRSIETLKYDIQKVSKISTDFKNQGETFGHSLGEDFLNLSVNLYRAERGLASLINWLKRPEDKHFLILFQNPSEMRPAGGFLGSYADLTLNPDGLKEIKVWDIYDPDGQLDQKIIPPKELQGITPWWGARDANWFFDFPASARKTISLLQKSKIYREQGISFEGALAINVNVLQTILGVIGPVTLPGYAFTITRDNFLSEIQREVESGADNRAGEPKRILKVLTPIVFQKISSFGEEDKKTLFKALNAHIAKKDIMLYFSDWELESYIQSVGMGGEVQSIPANWNGDYLAVVNANVAGGKSDAYVSEKIKLSTKIEPDGRIDNYLIIEKTHAGGQAQDPWYRAANQSYVKVFTPRGSRLTFLKGNEIKNIKPLVDYSAARATKDPDLRYIEESSQKIKEYGADQMEESDKTVFGAWFKVGAGTTKKLELQYFSPNKISLGTAPLKYKFLFEKQSGAHASLDFLIQAPAAYKWLESNSQNFNYVTDDPLGRETVELTLVPDLAINQR